MVPLLCRAVKGKQPQRLVLKAVVSEFIYDVWGARNRCIFYGVIPDWPLLVRNVVHVAFGRYLIKLVPFCDSLLHFPVVRSLALA